MNDRAASPPAVRERWIMVLTRRPGIVKRKAQSRGTPGIAEMARRVTPPSSGDPGTRLGRVPLPGRRLQSRRRRVGTGGCAYTPPEPAIRTPDRNPGHHALDHHNADPPPQGGYPVRPRGDPPAARLGPRSDG